MSVGLKQRISIDPLEWFFKCKVCYHIFENNNSIIYSNVKKLFVGRHLVLLVYISEIRLPMTHLCFWHLYYDSFMRKFVPKI